MSSELIRGGDEPPTELNVYLRNGIQACVTVSHSNSMNAGWWNDIDTGLPIDVNKAVPEKLCLIHSEISEALEGHRKNKMDEHLPDLESMEVELADAIIRICDLAGAMGYKLGRAVERKLLYNMQRPDHKVENRRKEGGKKF